MCPIFRYSLENEAHLNAIIRQQPVAAMFFNLKRLSKVYTNGKSFESNQSMRSSEANQKEAHEAVTEG